MKNIIYTMHCSLNRFQTAYITYDKYHPKIYCGFKQKTSNRNALNVIVDIKGTIITLVKKYGTITVVILLIQNLFAWNPFFADSFKPYPDKIKKIAPPQWGKQPYIICITYMRKEYHNNCNTFHNFCKLFVHKFILEAYFIIF